MTVCFKTSRVCTHDCLNLSIPDLVHPHNFLKNKVMYFYIHICDHLPTKPAERVNRTLVETQANKHVGAKQTNRENNIDFPWVKF